MRNENWNSERPNLARPRFKETPAKSYFNPEFRKVSVAARPDGEDFLVPSPDGHHADLLANLPDGGATIPNNGSVVVDCGLEATPPPGYKFRVEGCLGSCFVSLVDSPRLKLSVFNPGEEVTLAHKQNMAKIWIEPVYFIEWVTED